MLTVIPGTYEGTGYEAPDGSFPGADPSLPSIAPTFSTSGTSEIMVEGLTIGPVPAVISGDEVSSPWGGPGIDYAGVITSELLDPGSNWAGYVGGTGEADIPYSIELDVTYTPEPSTFILLGSVMVGLAWVSRREFVTRT